MSAFISTQRDFPSILTGRVAALEKDPADLDAAVKAGAFDGLRIAVRDLGATGTIATIAASGLRGRGGAGYPTGEKWRAAASRSATQRYVVANGYGADPGSHTDAALLAADPYLVLEGLAIAAFAVGATEAILAVRADDPALVTKLEGAALAAEEAGFLGDNVLNSGQRVTVTIRPVQGAFMLGEETVLLKALEGKRGQPEQKPPYPTETGLFGKPTVVNNVQTLADRPVDRPPGRRGVRGDRRRGQPGHGARPAPRPRRRRHRRGAVRDAAADPGQPRGRPRRPCAQGHPDRRADGRAAAGRRASTCRTPTGRCARPAPTSAPARSCSPTTARASSTSPGC